LDSGEDAGVLLNGVTCTVSVPHMHLNNTFYYNVQYTVDCFNCQFSCEPGLAGGSLIGRILVWLGGGVAIPDAKQGNHPLLPSCTYWSWSFTGHGHFRRKEPKLLYPGLSDASNELDGGGSS